MLFFLSSLLSLKLKPISPFAFLTETQTRNLLFLPSSSINISSIYISSLCFYARHIHLPRLSREVTPCTPLPTVASKNLLASNHFAHTLKIMSPQRELKSSQALEGVHGVQVVPHAPFSLEEISQDGDFQSTHDKSFITANQPLLMQVWQQRPSCFKPVKYCCIHGDRNVVETVANVLTSLPFIALGIQAPRKNLNTKLYANSLIGVGVASSFYHSSRGKLRKYLRWVDYTMIATATVCLSRALRNENPKLLMAASALLLPIQPLMVSAVHTGMMEVAFARKALKDPDLRMAHNVHKMSSLLGGAFYIADDVFPSTPFLHAAWHLAAAVGVGTCNKLLD